MAQEINIEELKLNFFIDNKCLLPDPGNSEYKLYRKGKGEEPERDTNYASVNRADFKNLKTDTDKIEYLSHQNLKLFIFTENGVIFLCGKTLPNMECDYSKANSGDGDDEGYHNNCSDCSDESFYIKLFKLQKK